MALFKMAKAKVYSKFIAAVLTGALGLGATMGLDLAPGTKELVMSLVPFIGAVFVYWVPNG